MAYMAAIGPCFNAELAPSIRIDGVREPICQGCVDRANVKRKELGNEPIEVLPGAYEPEECL